MEGLVISDAVKDLIINIVNIIVLFVIVKTLAYKPVKKFLDDRKAKIEKQLSDAAEAQKQADEKAQRYEGLISDSKKECAELKVKAEREAKESADAILANAKADADVITAKAREDAQREHDAKIASVKDDITELAFDISRQVLSREVSDEDNKRIAEGFFNERL